MPFKAGGTTLRIVEGKSKTGQRSGLMTAGFDEPMLSAAKVVAIDDGGTKTGNEQFFFPMDHLEDGSEAFGTVLNEAAERFGVVEFLIDSGKGDGNGILACQVGFSEEGSAFESDVEHECHECGKEQCSFVLVFYGIVEEWGEFFGVQKSLEDGSQADGGGGMLDEGFNVCSEVGHGSEGGLRFFEIKR